MSRAMKDSGIPWIREIPSHWDTFTIKHIMRNKSVRGFPNEQVLSLYREYGVVPKDSRDDNHNVTSEDTSGYKLVDVGDFVINKMKAWQGSMAVSEYRGIISPAYYICTFTAPVNRRYIHYLLRNDTYKAEYMRLSTGLRIGQWDLNVDDFLHIPMVLPPQPEQNIIADFLDKKCGEIDEMVSLQEKIIEELEAYKQSVITEAVCRGLNPKAPMKDSGIEWIGKIPNTWRIVRIKNVLQDSGDITTTGEGEPLSVTQNRGIIKSREIEVANPSMSTIGWKVVKKNDIVFNKYKAHSGVFFVSPYDGIVTFNYSVYRCFHEQLPKYYEYLFKTSGCIGEFRKEMRGVGESISPLYTKDLFTISIQSPPFLEQKAIADYLDTKCSEIDTLISLKQSKIDTLKEYKKSMVFEYITGKKEING